MFRILLSLCLSAFCSYVIAQDSLLYVTSQTVEITANKLDLTGDKLDTETAEIVTMLTRASSIHVQSSGPGLLATPLIHGFGARHTAILWKEFNIQSPINGTFDLGLLTGFDQVSYTDRSQSALLGTASLGGAIILDNTNVPKSTKLNLAISSTENMSVSITHGFSVSKFKSQIGLKAINNQNAFNYKWAGEKNKWLTDVRGADFKWDNQYHFSKQLKLEGNIWISKFDRNLPSSLASTRSFANQTDDNYRFQTSLTYTTELYAVKLNYAHFDEGLDYKTSAVDSQAKNKVNAINFSLATGKHKLNLSHRNDNPDANFFEAINTRNLSTISYQYDLQWDSNLSSRAVITEQLIDDDWSPLLFDFSTTYTSKKLIADLSINSAYNTPTLNDLYWPQGGNINLLPERSYGIDLSLKYAVNKGTSLTIAPYYKRVSNWILWTPGDQFWSPKNQRSVLSRGFDINLNYNPNSSLSLGIEFTYTKATIAEELIFKELEGNQLLYVPKIKSNAWLIYSLGSWSLKPNVLVISQRFTTTDNENSIPGFLIADLQIAKQIKLKNEHTMDIGITAHNLLNEDYQQVEFYPMPLRYIELNLSYKLNRK